MRTRENTARAFDADRMSESACILDLADTSDVPRWRVGVLRVVFRIFRGGAAPSAIFMFVPLPSGISLTQRSALRNPLSLLSVVAPIVTNAGTHFPVRNNVFLTPRWRKTLVFRTTFGQNLLSQSPNSHAGTLHCTMIQ